MEKVKSSLSKVSESALMALWEKAYVLHDPAAIELINKIDYDFQRFRKWGLWFRFITTNTDFFDLEIRSYIATNPNAVIVNIGAGLDTRFHRVDNGSIHWYEVDLPDIIALRQQLFTETTRYRTIASSAAEPTWASQIPKDHPILIVAEASLMYLTKDEVRQFFSIATLNFPGADLVFDVLGPLLTKFKIPTKGGSNRGSDLQWSISDPEEITALNQKIIILNEYENADSLRSALAAKILGNWIIHARTKKIA
jgi:O-methyltransferase involved in polyketide biosynthesis